MKIPTDIEIIGYRNVGINLPVTSEWKDPQGLNSFTARVQFDPNKEMLALDLGHGRQIRIRLFANQTNISQPYPTFYKEVEVFYELDWFRATLDIDYRWRIYTSGDGLHDTYIDQKLEWREIEG
jgi:hypothetical protein